jgi:hypothetical protein
MSKINQYITPTFFLLVGLALFIRIFLARNGVLDGWDESIYAQLGVEWVKHPDFILYYNGQPWLEKPFLIGFVTGVLHFISPYNKVALQAFFGIISMVNLYFVWRLAKRYVADNPLALLAPIFVINSYLFFERATTVNTDTLLVFGLLGYYVFKEKCWAKLAFLCIAVWSKSLLGFLPLILDIVLDFKQPLTRKSMMQHIFCVLVPSLWYIYAYIRYGNDFIQKHFVEQIFTRASSTLESHTGEWWFYLDYFAKSSPFALALLISIIIGFLSLYRYKKESIRIDITKYPVLLFGVIYFFIISSSKSKLEWYLLPVIYVLSPIVPILSQNINKKALNTAITFFVISGLLFILLVPFFSRNSPENIELINLGKCIHQLPQKQAILLQNSQNIEKYHQLTSSGGSVSSTFRYGDNPAFIYYARKDMIQFVYDSTIPAQNTDTILITPRYQLFGVTASKNACSTENYDVF